MDLTWSLDYCLACDRQVTSGGAYCSQSCRVADLELSSHWSRSTLPTTSTPSLPSAPSDSHKGSGFYLAPAIKFASTSLPSTPTLPAVNKTDINVLSSSLAKSLPTNDRFARTLTASSSRSSLSSTSGESIQTSHFSEQVHNELRAYTNSFDTSRNWRRRMTWS